MGSQCCGFYLKIYDCVKQGLQRMFLIRRTSLLATGKLGLVLDYTGLHATALKRKLSLHATRQILNKNHSSQLRH